MPKVKCIDIAEFRDKGYLQEVNRQFLHPLGLALSVVINEDGSASLGGICDYRDDPEGVYYDIALSDEARRKQFREKAKYVEAQREKFYAARESLFGDSIEGLD
jgi:hypothetical protein